MSGGLDKYTKLLLHMDDSSFKDEIGNVINNAGGVTLDNTDKKFGSGCSRYEGVSTNYLEIPTNLDKFNFGLDLDFTIDFWIRYSGVKNGVYTQYPTILHTGYAWKTGSICLMIDTVDWKRGIGICCYDGGGLVTNELPDIADNKWKHIAVVRKDKVFYLYINGILQVSSPSNFKANFSYNGGPLIGRKGKDATTGCFCGKLDEFRISNIARWDTNFIPPNYQYYIESYFIKSNDLYYSIDPENYNPINDRFNSITLDGGDKPNLNDVMQNNFIELNQLIDEMNINGEIFKPIDKLDERFKISVLKN